MLYNVIELIYDFNEEIGCKIESRGHYQFDKVYIEPYGKT
jgi:hypothetical protein